MIKRDEKISHKQVIFILFSLTYTIMMRAGSSIMAIYAKQAAWLSPLFMFIGLAATVLIMGGIYRSNRNNDLNLMDIMKIVFGKPITVILLVFYLIYITLLLADITRFYSTRLTLTIFTQIDRIYFIFILLMIIAIGLEIGLGVIARMSEVIFPILVIIFTSVFLLLIPQMHFDNLFPVSYKDIIPAAKGSIGILAPCLIYTFIFFAGDKIKDKKNIKKHGIIAAIFYLTVMIMLALETVGTIGYKYTADNQIPYMVAMKHVNLFETIQRIESVAIALWIISDFVIIAILINSILCIIKWIFDLNETKSIKNIFIVIIGVLSLTIAKNLFRLSEFELFLLLPASLIFGTAIPLMILVTGKIRKKI